METETVKTMKVLFLAIDGVLNDKPCDPTGPHLDPKLCVLAQQIIDVMGAKIVLSSSWRLKHGIREQLAAVGLTGEIIDVLPHGPIEDRDRMIADYLRSASLERYVVLDDQALQVENLVQTDGHQGLTPENVAQAIEILNRQSPPGRVCIVGNGPSAHGKGQEIDAVDYVIRLKAWWRHGALDVGRKCNATAWYGDRCGWDTVPERLNCEYWMTVPVDVIGTLDRLCQFLEQAGIEPIRWCPLKLWQRVVDYMGHQPSTGATAVAMAMEILRPSELLLFGFDSCGPDRPNYANARRSLLASEIEKPPHDFLREKQVFAELLGGKWLGQKVETRLVWHAMPDIDEVMK